MRRPPQGRYGPLGPRNVALERLLEATLHVVCPGEEFVQFFRVVVGSALKKRLQGNVGQEGAPI